MALRVAHIHCQFLFELVSLCLYLVGHHDIPRGFRRKTFATQSRGQSLAALRPCHLWFCLSLSLQCWNSTYYWIRDSSDYRGKLIFFFYSNHFLYYYFKIENEHMYVSIIYLEMSWSNFHAITPISCWCNDSSKYMSSFCCCNYYGEVLLWFDINT